MKQPSPNDRVVKVCAFLTDESFGYEHWQAKQFLSPDDARPAVLVICETESERDALMAGLLTRMPTR